MELPKLKSSRRMLNEEESKRVEFVFKFFEKGTNVEMREVDLNFLISVQGQYERDGKLSDLQLEIIEKIFARY